MKEFFDLIWKLAIIYVVAFGIFWLYEGLFNDSCVFHLDFQNSNAINNCRRRRSIRRRQTERYYDRLERELERDGYY